MSDSIRKPEPEISEDATLPPSPTKRRPRPSEQRAFEDRDKWANSRGLQPPK